MFCYCISNICNDFKDVAKQFADFNDFVIILMHTIISKTLFNDFNDFERIRIFEIFQFDFQNLT